ncbi:MAG: hypothetical protein ACI4S2_12565 [Lachnospiraceae bacterium]
MKKKNYKNFANMGEQEFVQRLLLNSMKRYNKNRTMRNVTVWIATSAIIFALIRIKIIDAASTDNNWLISILSDAGLSLVLGLITCFVGLLMISFINEGCFNLEYDENQLLELEKQYVEKYGYDEFYYSYIYKNK